MLRGCEGVKPGWTRLNFNRFLSDRVFDYIVDAVGLVADQGWKLLPYYVFEADSGQWHHRDRQAVPVMRLADVSYESGRLEYSSRHTTEPESSLRGHLERARKIFAAAQRDARRCVAADPALRPDFEKLRWFPLPSEALPGLAASIG